MKTWIQKSTARRRIAIWTAVLALLLPLLIPAAPPAPAAAAAGDYLLTANRLAYASSVRGANGPQLAFDGDPATRWESRLGQDPQWLYVDLGAQATLSRAVIKWEGAYSKSFRIETSNDESAWTPVYANANASGGTTDVALSGSGRYVRLYSVQRALPAYGVSLYEFELYGTGGAGPAPQPAPINAALGRPAVSSSEAGGSQPKDYATANVTDGGLSSRWASQASDPQWIYVDLGQSQRIGKVVLRWETAFGRVYDIQVSDDARSWTTVYRQRYGAGGKDEIPLYASGRYVRMLGIGRGTNYGYSLYEFEVYSYRTGDPQPSYSIAPLPQPSTVQVGSGSYEIGDVTQLEPLYPKNRTSGVNAPIPSNDWWQNLLVQHLGAGTGIVTLPLKAKYSANGLGLLNPGAGAVNGDGGAVNADGDPDLYLSASNLLNPKALESKVDGYGDYSVRVVLSDDDTPKMKSVLAKGSPYVYSMFSDPNSPELFVPGLIRAFDDSGQPLLAAEGSAVTADHIGLEIATLDNAVQPKAATRSYGVFAPPGTVFTRAGGKIKMKLGGGANYLSLAGLPGSGDLNYFYKHAYAFVTDTKVAYGYDMSQAKVSSTFTSVTELKRSGFSADTLTALLPHQWKSSSAPLTGLSYPSIRGTLKLREGNSFSTSDSFTGLLPQFAEPNDSAYSRSELTGYLSQLDTELANTAGLMNQDPYWQGKVLYPAALGAMVSDSIGDAARRDRYLGILRSILTDWYTYSSSDALHTYYFHYAPEWGSIFPWAAGWGINTGLTDHHYTYGYYVYASAVLASFDSAFKRDYGGMVEQLIRDYANPSRTDSMYPWLRSFDPYEGHSWAGAYADNDNGNNQEAAGEALNGWAGLFLWGLVTGNDSYRDTGAWGFSTELKAIEQYWFNYDHDNWIPDYRHGVAGQVWGSAYLYGTYFSGAPVNIYGIHWLPTAEWMSYYGRYPQKAADLYASFLKDNGGPESGWEHIVWPYQSLSDPQAAIAKWNPSILQKNEIFNSYWFIHNMASYGSRTADIWASNWAGVGIYKKGSAYTAMAWNPTDQPIIVQFRNAAGPTGSVAVPPHKLVKADPLSQGGGATPTPAPTDTPTPTPTATPTPAPTATPTPAPGAALDRTGWTATSSPSSGDAAANLLDGSMATRWSTGAAMAPGQSITIDMKASKTFSKLTMDSTGSDDDYARGYEIYVSADGAGWGSSVASGAGTGPVVAATFAVKTARYIKIVQTGTSTSWWSVRELNVYGASGGTTPSPSPTPTPTAAPSPTPAPGAALDRTGWTASSTPSSGDVPASLLDGSMATRWSTGAAMAPGQSITIDMKASKTFSKLTMDSTGSDGDYARGYEIYVSADGASWGSAVAAGAGTGPVVTASFAAKTARYIKIVQTGTSSSWWSIRELNVYLS
ncbi:MULTISPECIES: discoidin domain-containing protein [unclassified Paenibacillus]|uniref:discoidin domain-containing protein n=1 Tax=unclassified Paenibacillus TaxID=185978 RepID=UPI000953D349|nr:MULTISPECIES: discoidin domain-containing protein [unclassified Paenibacillus]ASS68372.1 coagulation factor 5/8 type domain protein [Paenibacillus sp. RUD330]SIR30929.1 Endoglucanase Acf2 [Paenibacillus sp. RU4X]SIR42592.1 Endoglucanase Acf2 [Paenibacillus sp. RU4T]